jgi:hypothetical protein
MKFNIKRFAFVLFFALLIFNLFGSLNVVSAAGGDTITYNINEGNVIDTSHGFGKIFNFLNLTPATWRELILAFLVLLIIFAGMFDILQMISIFQTDWVKVVIAIAIALAGALTGIVRKLAVSMAQWAAGLGAAAIFVEVIVCIAIFFGLAVGNKALARWNARRQAAMDEAQIIRKTGNIKGGIDVLNEVGRTTKKQRQH